MWSVKSWPNPGSASRHSRSAVGTGSEAGLSAKTISPLVPTVITDPLSPGHTAPVVSPGCIRSLACYALRDVVADLQRGPGCPRPLPVEQVLGDRLLDPRGLGGEPERSEEHTSELQSQFHLVCRL